MATVEPETDGPPVEEDNEPHSDDDEDDLKKPAWVGYFRLPKADVELVEPFLPKGAEAAAGKRGKKGKPTIAEMYNGWWTRRKTTGEPIGSKMKVLIKPVTFLSEREARILSIIAGDDESAAKHNVTRFYGAVLYPPMAEYRVVLEYCDLGYLRDYVLDTYKEFDPKDFAGQIANGMRYLHYGAPYHPIIHRNLHPLSVLLKSNGSKIVLKLHGFQHAKILAEHDTFGAGITVAPTNPGLWLGPELNLGVTKTDPASDVYSFGMVVWHLFSRKLPFDGRRMTEPQMLLLTTSEKKRPDMPPCRGCPSFWVSLIEKCWQDDRTERPDFIKIVKAMAQENESLLDPHKPLPEAVMAAERAEKQRESWELDPDSRPTEGEQILSSNKSTSTVVVARYEESVPGKKAKKVLKEAVLKKPVKLTTDRPTKAEFQAFMETAHRTSNQYILPYEGVLLLESIQMPAMEFSVRQHTKGKRIKDAKNKRKTIFKGFGSMLDTQVAHIMRCVLEGLHYLHSTTGVAHGGLSTSNVLCNKKGKSSWEVRLSDYNLSALGIESQSHANRFSAPGSVEGTPRGDLYSCGVMFVEMSTGKDRILDDKKKKKDWENARSEVKRKYPKIWKAVTHCEDCSRHSDLSARNVLTFL